MNIRELLRGRSLDIQWGYEFSFLNILAWDFGKKKICLPNKG